MDNEILSKNAYKYQCDVCHFNTSNKFDYNKHILTPKHKLNAKNAFLEINGNSKNAFKNANYDCEPCNFYSKNKSNYEKHLLTDKHKNKCNLVNEGKHKETKHICSQCNKEYMNYSGLWKHKKICSVTGNLRFPRTPLPFFPF